MSESNFLPKKYTSVFKNGTLTWESPSNIALVKYWGKYGEQLPAKLLRKNLPISQNIG